MDHLESRAELVVSSPTIVQISALTHRGLHRVTNEDCIGIGGWMRNVSEDAPVEFSLKMLPKTFLLIADGLGGHQSGALASQIAIASLSQALCEPTSISENSVAQILSKTNREIWTLLAGERQHAGAGTTVAGIICSPNECYAFNVGDSRVYRRRENFLQLLSTDDRLPTHSMAEQSNVLLQALGGSEEEKQIQPHIVTFPCVAGDEFLLCSDGLSDLITIDQLEDALGEDLSFSVAKLRDLVFVAGAHDNVSIIYARLV